MPHSTLTRPLAHDPAGAPAGWQSALAAAVRDPAELCRLLELPAGLAADAAEGVRGFPLLVPRPYLARIRHADAADPLLGQILPTREEQAEHAGFVRDPLGEAAGHPGQHNYCPGLLQKYRRRALILASGACGVHCRFCFRRHRNAAYPYPPHGNGGAFREGGTEKAAGDRRSPEGMLAHIAADQSIEEVILSGGDPLCLPDRSLAELAEQLAAIPHLRRLRVHSRLPIVIPQRVTEALLAWLRGTRLAPWVVVHANHPAEIDDAVAAALGRLVDAGIPVLNQTVLLRGVNDRAEVLTALCRRLADLRVRPYYLHQLDRVAGAAHFEVPVARGLELMDALRAELPGYALPRYVRDRPGTAGKEVLA
jgi:EF-P beta-lysylation protein EpmB